MWPHREEQIMGSRPNPEASLYHEASLYPKASLYHEASL